MTSLIEVSAQLWVLTCGFTHMNDMLFFTRDLRIGNFHSNRIRNRRLRLHQCNGWGFLLNSERGLWYHGRFGWFKNFESVRNFRIESSDSNSNRISKLRRSLIFTNADYVSWRGYDICHHVFVCLFVCSITQKRMITKCSNLVQTMILGYPRNDIV